jgi:hypothetical protein
MGDRAFVNAASIEVPTPEEVERAFANPDATVLGTACPSPAGGSLLTLWIERFGVW